LATYFVQQLGKTGIPFGAAVVLFWLRNISRCPRDYKKRIKSRDILSSSECISKSHIFRECVLSGMSDVVGTWIVRHPYLAVAREVRTRIHRVL